MAKRYELSHRHWERLKDSLSGKVMDCWWHRPKLRVALPR